MIKERQPQGATWRFDQRPAVCGLDNRALISWLAAVLCSVASISWMAGFPDTVSAQNADAAQAAAGLPFRPEKNWMSLTRDHEVWMDLQKKEILVGGRICLREGMLEMFSCPKGTKEHESIVAVNTPARYVHAALVALGAEPGPPVQFEPVYRPAQGTEVQVTVIWKDQEGKQHQVAAQEWVKQMKTGKALQYPWVFAGSGFWTDEEAGERYYYADGGEFICVSNFSTAMLDLPVRSSDANSALIFSAFSEKIPPLGTRVFLKLAPKLKEPTSTGGGAKTPAEAPEKALDNKEGDRKAADEPGTDEAGRQPTKQPAGSRDTNSER